jgi:hypothetical protein
MHRRAQKVFLRALSSNERLSSVTVPTMQAVLPVLFAINLPARETEIGGLKFLAMKSLLRTTELKLESVRRERKRYSLTRSLMYTFSDRGSVLCFCLILPWERCPLSIPYVRQRGRKQDMHHS